MGRWSAYRLPRLVPIALSIWVLACADAIAADPPAGIVMQVSGNTVPPVLQNSEIAGPIQVPPGSRLVLLHYQTCTLVAVTGGVITLSSAAIDDSAATIESRRPAPCPHIRRVTAGGGELTAGAAVLRGTPPLPAAAARFPAELELILTGGRAPSVTSVEILDGRGAVAARGTASGLRASLRQGEAYRVRILFAGGAPPKEVPFTASTSEPPGPAILGLD